MVTAASASVAIITDMTHLNRDKAATHLAILANNLACQMNLAEL
jgi:hypothetical protein